MYLFNYSIYNSESLTNCTNYKSNKTDKMPQGLKVAYHQLDLAIEKYYRSKPFENDQEKLEYLFKLYEEMTAK